MTFSKIKEFFYERKEKRQKKDIALIMKELYVENVPNNDGGLDNFEDKQYDYLDIYKRVYRGMAYLRIVESIEKIYDLMKSNKYVNSGYTYRLSYPLTKECYETIKWSLMQKALDDKQRKRFYMCKKVLPFLYKNMKYDKHLTPEIMNRIESEFDELKLDKSCLKKLKSRIKFKPENLDNCDR